MGLADLFAPAAKEKFTRADREVEPDIKHKKPKERKEAQKQKKKEQNKAKHEKRKKAAAVPEKADPEEKLENAHDAKTADADVPSKKQKKGTTFDFEAEAAPETAAKEGAAAGKEDPEAETDAPPTDPERTIFVGNLPPNATIKSVKRLFTDYGKVKTARFRSMGLVGQKINDKGNQKQALKVAAIKKIMSEQRNNKNAYVVFEEKASAEKARAANGKLVGDKHIRVDTVGGQRDGKHNHRLSVFLGNLPLDTDEEAVRAAFSPHLSEGHAAIAGVRLIRNPDAEPDQPSGKGFGYLQLNDADSVAQVLALVDVVRVGARLVRIKVCAKRTKRTVEEEANSAAAFQEAAQGVGKARAGAANDSAAVAAAAAAARANSAGNTAAARPAGAGAGADAAGGDAAAAGGPVKIKAPFAFEGERAVRPGAPGKAMTGAERRLETRQRLKQLKRKRESQDESKQRDSRKVARLEEKAEFKAKAEADAERGGKGGKGGGGKGAGGKGGKGAGGKGGGGKGGAKGGAKGAAKGAGKGGAKGGKGGAGNREGSRAAKQPIPLKPKKVKEKHGARKAAQAAAAAGN
jgi:nucleolar protein 12